MIQADESKGGPLNPTLIVTDPSDYGGQRIGLFGRISKTPHQHLVDAEASRTHRVGYLQIDDGYQTVAYLPRSFTDCAGPVRLDGRVLEVRPLPSKPGEPQKRDDSPGMVEYHLLTEGWRCLEGDNAETWLYELGLDKTSETRREAIGAQLLVLGKDAMPMLLAHLRDQRQAGTRQRVPAAAVNAPHHAPAPTLETVPVQVSERVQELLYRLITPAYASPFAANFKPYSESVFLVRDWPAWWLAHQNQSLAEIHKALEPAVDAYWQSHGTTQVLN